MANVIRIPKSKSSLRKPKSSSNLIIPKSIKNFIDGFILVFDVQPENGIQDLPLNIIIISGAKPGNIVTLTPSIGLATGNTATANNEGIATFSNLILNSVGNNITLTASSSEASSVISNTFIMLLGSSWYHFNEIVFEETVQYPLKSNYKNILNGEILEESTFEEMNYTF